MKSNRITSARTDVHSSTNVEATSVSPNNAKPMLAAGLSLGQNMPVDKAQDAAVCDGRKIRHRLFDEHEFIFWSEGKWYTEDGYVLPSDYWKNKNEYFQIGWSVL